MLSKMKNDEQAILHYIRPHTISVLDVKKLRYIFTVGHWNMSNIWYIISNDRASESEIADYI